MKESYSLPTFPEIENPKSSDPNVVSVEYHVDQVAIATFPPGSLFQQGLKRMKENATGVFALQFKLDGTVDLKDVEFVSQIVDEKEKMVAVSIGEPLNTVSVEYFDNRK